MEAVPDGVLIVDRHGRILLVNGAACRIFGYPERSLEGLPIETLVPEPLQEGHRKLREGFSADPHTRAMGAASHIRGVRADGSGMDLDISLSTLELGGKLMILAIARDITRRREEEALLASQRAALEERNRELEELNRLKNQLLGVAAHDLRSPLAAVRMGAEVLLRGSLGSLTPQQRGLLGELEEMADYMLNLVNDTLDLSRIEAGALNLRLGRVEMERLAERTVAMNRPVALQKGVELELEVEPDLHTIRADSSKVRQVLDNLISNAIKFTEPGTRVTVRVAAAHPGVVISVHDEGPGIPQDRMATLFEPFQRGRPDGPVLTGRERSTGLGLAIVRKIVQGHGGDIRVESRPGGGATFQVVLPEEAEQQTD